MAALPNTGRYAKSSVRRDLRSAHPTGLEPVTFGSVGRLPNHAKSQEILGFSTVSVYSSVLVGNCKPVQINAFRRGFGGKRADKW
jgi:hypothetical protein